MQIIFNLNCDNLIDLLFCEIIWPITKQTSVRPVGLSEGLGAMHYDVNCLAQVNNWCK